MEEDGGGGEKEGGYCHFTPSPGPEGSLIAITLLRYSKRPIFTLEPSETFGGSQPSVLLCYCVLPSSRSNFQNDDNYEPGPEGSLIAITFLRYSKRPIFSPNFPNEENYEPGRIRNISEREYILGYTS